MNRRQPAKSTVPEGALSTLNTTVAEGCGCITQPEVVPMRLLSVPLSTSQTKATSQRAQIVRPTKQLYSAQ